VSENIYGIHAQVISHEGNKSLIGTWNDTVHKTAWQLQMCLGYTHKLSSFMDTRIVAQRAWVKGALSGAVSNAGHVFGANHFGNWQPTLPIYVRIIGWRVLPTYL
jgi:hypothetical protein